MKKLLSLLFLLLLLLSACAGGETETTAPTTEILETTPLGLYVPGSEAEVVTQGAVRQYALEQDGSWGLCAFQERVVLFSGEEQTVLSVLNGEDCIPGATTVLPLDVRQGGFSLINGGVAYYDKNQNRAVYLDGDLQCFRTMELPDDIQGLPAFSYDGGEVFVCIGQEIRGMDTQRGLSRLIKSHNIKSQSLTGAAFDGRLVVCAVETEDGIKETRYISTENGATLSTDYGVERIVTDKERFFVSRMDGTVAQSIYGTNGQDMFLLGAPEGQIIPALELGAAVGVGVNDTGLALRLYDLDTGCVTSAVTIPGEATVVSACADSRSGCLWVLTDAENLYRWDVKATPVTEDVSYAGTVFTRRTPDEEGLKALQTRVDDLNRTHGTAIRIWDAAANVTGGHTLVSEYQTAAIQKSLDDLEAAMGKFPESFLRKSVNTKIRICIVRSVDSDTKMVWFWNGGDAYILLPCGVNVEQELIRAMGYIVDIHSLGNSPMLDEWDKLNPEGFVYGESEDAKLAEGEGSAFADTESMVSVSEERARLFYYAMTPEGAEFFKSPVLQKKLLLMCQAIRDAWRLEKKAETYLWEQYLTESIAYQK